jgi:hypothetical protein
MPSASVKFAVVCTGVAAFKVSKFSSNVNIPISTFTNNRVTNGSALHITQCGNTDLSGTSFRDNVGVNGAAFYYEGNVLSLNGITAERNQAKGSAGALYLKHASASSTISFGGGEFYDNNVTDDTSGSTLRDLRGGGAIRIDGDGSTTLSGTSFRRNAAVYAPAYSSNQMVGGALMILRSSPSAGGKLQFNGGTYSDNAIRTLSASRGSGVYADVAQVTVLGAAFERNLHEPMSSSSTRRGAAYFKTVRLRFFFLFFFPRTDFSIDAGLCLTNFGLRFVLLFIISFSLKK